MSSPCEYTLAEKPVLDSGELFGYSYLSPSQNELAREGLNQVILSDTCKQAISRINDVSMDVAQRTYQDLLRIKDNERFASVLRGNYSRRVPGQSEKKTIRLIDFLHPERNTFTVTNQFSVRAERTRRPDVVVFVNGIPLIVVEAKSPVSPSDKTDTAFEQIKLYEQDIPRLFYSNAFSIVTDGVKLRYGTTGAPSEYWGSWKDPWPRACSEFDSDFHMQLWSLLEPSRLLDMIAHFIVFETQDSKTVKKMCRYQQYRATNKIVDRVVEDCAKRGLIWHTQGSGKSLTMAFSALKLKSHRTISSENLENPNILVVTDRIDLDDQIAKTFQACGLRNPIQIGSVRELREYVHSHARGQTLLSTIFKFEGSTTPVENSSEWIILVDECHRTQEKDLGAFLRATFPDAWYFGFTGTPIKKADLNTYQNFGPAGEIYLDKYGIEDAVADGATVPIRYTSRKADWQLEDVDLDILFDNWFRELPKDDRERLKTEGVTLAQLAKHEQRISIIAKDIWAHFQEHAEPNGFKAQIVAIDRQAIVLYKRALDHVISESLMRKGMNRREALEGAESMVQPIYSPNREDEFPSEDPWVESIREYLRKYSRDGAQERELINRFKDPDSDLKILIVCNKLLTGFDAPVEAVMYLDSPLKEHNLLQAIARTNRVYGDFKQYGLVVDYIGVTQHLKDALSTYRSEDVDNAMLPLDDLKQELEAAHREVMRFLSDIAEPSQKPSERFSRYLSYFSSEDTWFTFKRLSRRFVKLYEAVSPDSYVLQFRDDMKEVAALLNEGRTHLEQEDGTDLSMYAPKIREILKQHLEVTGIRDLITLRKLDDPVFWDEFEEAEDPDEQRLSALKKAADLKAVLKEKVSDNPLRYEKFSDRVREILDQFERRQIEAAEALESFRDVAEGIQSEDRAYKDSGLSKSAYGLYRILEAFSGSEKEELGVDEGRASFPAPSEEELIEYLKMLAGEIEEIYTSPDSAPAGWHLKSQLKKELRRKVRRKAYNAEIPEEHLTALTRKVEEYALKFYVRAN